MWIRSNGAFEALVDPGVFARAQAIIAERSRRPSDEEMIGGLKQTFERHGYLSGLVIDEAEGLPSSSAYQGRFGPIGQGYRRDGRG